MKVKLIVTVLGFFLSGGAFGQQKREALSLPEALLLAGTSGERTSSQNEKVKAFQIVNLTGDSLILGYIPLPEKGNERIALISPVDKQEYLEACVGENLNSFFASKGVQGILIVHDVGVGYTSSGIFARIKGVLYESQAATNSYTQTKEVDYLSTENGSNIKNATALLSSSIVAAVTSSATGVVTKEIAKGISVEELLKREKEKYTFISKGVFPTGIYLSYDDFKKGKPSFDHFYLRTDTSHKTVEINSFTIEDSTLVPTQNVWAIASANELYLYQDGMLRAVEAYGNNLVFSKYLDPEVRKNNGVFWRGTVGSRFEEWNAQNPFDERYVLGLNNYRNKGVNAEATKVNGDTGTPEL
ncbi:hypothetical protein [Niabella hirudinis]|uniref:hypothetical protein n=1 Tax=Niabella hirudinis TaxID=1285929 RepID=UPI003EC0039C